MRQPRINVSIDPTVLAALQASAEQRGVPLATLVTQMVTFSVMGTPAGAGPAPTPEAPPAAAAAPPVADGPEALRAQWLQLDRGPAWRTRMWELGEQLRVDYPDLAELTKQGWTADPFTRDGVLALAVWREQLNTGAQPDPRLEHQWLAALRDFKRMLEDRAGFWGARAKPLDRPPEW